LQAQLDDLKKGIDSLVQVKGNADKLKQERSQCYRRMAAYSDDPEVKKQYLDLAKTP
jgi:rubrerythrin